VTLQCTISSFGYKFGVEPDADWVIDSRMLRNPFWERELRPLTGLDPAVRTFVLAQPEAQRLLEWLEEMLTWSAPLYAERGRPSLHVAVGCTGGRHRSVVIAEALAERMQGNGVAVATQHRDVDKPDPRDAGE
jgi:RNase adapter protein RapZ